MAVIETYPNTGPSGNKMNAWEQWGQTLQPDSIVSGLEVTKIAPLKVRMAPGRAVCGGYIMVLTEELIMSVDPNLAGGTRIDRWVLERFVVGDEVVVEPVLLTGNPPIGPAMTQLGLPNSWMIPVARWAVTSASNQVQYLTNDGPGPALGQWGFDIQNPYRHPNNADDGFPIELMYPAFLPDYSRGPQPASVSGKNLAITISGIYAIEYRVFFPQAQPAIAAPDDPYIRLRLPRGDVRAAFDVGAFGAAYEGEAAITAVFAVNTVPFEIEPRFYQNTGSPQALTAAITLERRG